MVQGLDIVTVVSPTGASTHTSYSDISFGMCLCLMSWVQQVHSAAAVVASASGFKFTVFITRHGCAVLCVM